MYLTSLGCQLILAYNWARPAVLAAGKDRGGMFLFLLFFHFHSFSCLPYPSLSSPLLPLLSLFSLSLGDDTEADVSLNPISVNQLLRQKHLQTDFDLVAACDLDCVPLDWSLVVKRACRFCSDSMLQIHVWGLADLDGLLNL